MSETSTPTLAELAAEVRDLRARLEDLEDLRDLETAIEENAGKPLTDWEQVKQELDIEPHATGEAGAFTATMTRGRRRRRS